MQQKNHFYLCSLHSFVRETYLGALKQSIMKHVLIPERIYLKKVINIYNKLHYLRKYRYVFSEIRRLANEQLVGGNRVHRRCSGRCTGVRQSRGRWRSRTQPRLVHLHPPWGSRAGWWRYHHRSPRPTCTLRSRSGSGHDGGLGCVLLQLLVRQQQRQRTTKQRPTVTKFIKLIYLKMIHVHWIESNI